MLVRLGQEVQALPRRLTTRRKLFTLFLQFAHRRATVLRGHLTRRVQGGQPRVGWGADRSRRRGRARGPGAAPSSATAATDTTTRPRVASAAMTDEGKPLHEQLAELGA